LLNRRTTDLDTLIHIGASPHNPAISTSIDPKLAAGYEDNHRPLGPELADFLEQLYPPPPGEDELPAPSRQKRDARVFRSEHIFLLSPLGMVLVGAGALYVTGGVAAVGSAMTGMLAIAATLLGFTALICLPFFILWLLGRL